MMGFTPGSRTMPGPPFSDALETISFSKSSTALCCCCFEKKRYSRKAAGQSPPEFQDLRSRDVFSNSRLCECHAMLPGKTSILQLGVQNKKRGTQLKMLWTSRCGYDFRRLFHAPTTPWVESTRVPSISKRLERI